MAKKTARSKAAAAPPPATSGTRRSHPHARRTFSAAQMGGILSTLGLGTKIRDDILKQLHTLQRRSNELAKNNPHIRSYLSVLKNNVIGPKGFRMQSRAQDPDGTLDTLAISIIEEQWKQWSRTAVTSGGSFLELQWSLINRLAVDGEVFIQLVQDADGSLQLHPLPAHHFNPYITGKTKAGNEVYSSVEIDKFNRPVAYWFDSAPPKDMFSLPEARLTMRHVRIPAEDILHIFIRDEPMQLRGIPWTSPAMIDLHLLEKYTEAHLVASVVAAAQSHFFTSKAGEDWLPEDDDDRTTDLEVTPGSYHALPPGMGVESTKPEFPITGFEEFENAILNRIAAGLNIPFSSLTGKTTSENFSSMRATEMQQRYQYRRIHEFLIDCFFEPAYRKWLHLELKKGMLTPINGRPLPIEKESKFQQVQFIPRGFQAVQPERQVAADIQAIKAGLTSATRVLAENGLDIEEILKERQREKALAESLGLKDIADLQEAQIREILAKARNEDEGAS